MALACGGAAQVRPADPVGPALGEGQRPGCDAVGKFALAGRAQRDQRAADEIVARGGQARPQADQRVRRAWRGALRILRDPIQECLCGFVLTPCKFEPGAQFFGDWRNFLQIQRRNPTQGRRKSHSHRRSGRRYRHCVINDDVERPAADRGAADAGDAGGRFDIEAAFERGEYPGQRAPVKRGARGSADTTGPIFSRQRHACRLCPRWRRRPGQGAR